jgi:dihydrodipicolinate reductase
MKWVADVKIAGPVGSMGQRVLQPIVNQQISQVLKSLEGQVEAAKTETASKSDGPVTPTDDPGDRAA